MAVGLKVNRLYDVTECRPSFAPPTNCLGSNIFMRRGPRSRLKLHCFLQQRTPVSNPERFIGEYYTDEVITLHNVAGKISKYKEENDTHQHLLFTLERYEFPLTYIGDYVFEMIQENLCNNFFLGINGERIYFTKPKNPQDKVEEFVIYGIHLKGMATFRRKQKMNN